MARYPGCQPELASGRFARCAYLSKASLCLPRRKIANGVAWRPPVEVLVRVRVLFATISASAVLCAIAPRAESLDSPRRLPELRLPGGATTAAVHYALWSHRADAADGPLNALAIGGGIVAFAIDGRICGFKESTGRMAWCANAGASPVFASGRVVYRAAGGTVRAVNARTGTESWHDHRKYATALWSATSGSIVANGKSIQGSAYRELDGDGTSLWETRFSGSIGQPYFAFPYVVQSVVMSGATSFIDEYLLRLGRGGGLKAHLGSAATIAGVEPGSIILARGRQRVDLDDRFLTFDVLSVDYTGKVRSHFQFAPDYSTNARYFHEHRSSVAGQEESAASVREELGWIFGRVIANVYRYRLDAGQHQRPDLISSGDQWVGGPYRGALFFSRSDGLWVLHPKTNSITAQLVAPSTTGVAAFAVAGDQAYVGFADGKLRGFNVETGATTLDSKTCVPKRIGASSLRVFVVCDSRSPRTTVVAFAKR